jgi:hypothetical protein
MAAVKPNRGHNKKKEGGSIMIRMLAEVMTIAIGGYAPRPAGRGEYRRR